MNKLHVLDEVVFVGADGIERKAWVARVHGIQENDGPVIDVTMTEPGTIASPDETQPAKPPKGKAQEEAPEAHPPIPPDQELSNVLHEADKKPNRSYWKRIDEPEVKDASKKAEDTRKDEAARKAAAEKAKAASQKKK